MKKPAKAWKPIPVAVQIKQHHKAVVAARKAAAHPAGKAAKTKRSIAAKKAAATRAKHRKWSPDCEVALCSARAVAQSLTLALGVPVSHDDVLALYWATAGDADSGASILATLEAAQRTGLSGHRPEFTQDGDGDLLILGVDWPQPHAVTAHDGAWWSWGEAWQPWDSPVSETWAVSWR